MKDKVIIEVAKNGLQIPVLNDVYLHSKFDPYKEAETLVGKYKSTIESKSNLLILGLGFGYHVKLIEQLSQTIHGKNSNVTVIEPSSEVYKEYLNLFGSKNINAKIFCSDNPNSIYKDSEFIDLILNKPGIIAHQTSLNLHQEYFKNFMSHIKSKSLKENSADILGVNWENYLATFKSNNLTEISEEIEKTNNSNSNKFYLLALENCLLSEKR